MLGKVTTTPSSVTWYGLLRRRRLLLLLLLLLEGGLGPVLRLWVLFSQGHHHHLLFCVGEPRSILLVEDSITNLFSHFPTEGDLSTIFVGLGRFSSPFLCGRGSCCYCHNSSSLCCCWSCYWLYFGQCLTCFSSRYSEARDTLSVRPSLVRISHFSVVR